MPPETLNSKMHGATTAETGRSRLAPPVSEEITIKGLGLMEDAMNKHAAPSSLGKRVVAVLTGNGGNLPSAAELQDLIRDTELSVQANFDAAESERVKALDLVSCPDPAEAHERIAAARLAGDRLSAALPKLRDKLTEALASEERDRWWSDHHRVKGRLDAVVARFQEVQTAARLMADWFAEAEQVGKDVIGLNVRAPAGITRRLRSPELTARGLSRFTSETPSISANTVLPDPNHSNRNLWPLRSGNTLAAAFAEMSVMPSHPGQAWSSPEELARRKAGIESDQARSAAFHTQAAIDEEARINREERERFTQHKP
jgi:hypothetical protein